MTITEIARRNPAPQPWAEGGKIPWNEPGFSRRMLNEHLSQAHDMASRRASTINRQAEWIHRTVFLSKPHVILDLGCGPGLYADQFIKRGHSYTGIDFSPASIEYARKNAAQSASFIEGDIRKTDFGGGFTSAMSIFGEINVFTKEDAELILVKAFASLEKGGVLILEAHTHECVKRNGTQPPTWHSAHKGVFSERPYVCLMESFWNERNEVAIERFYIVDNDSPDIAFHTQSIQAYTDEQYRNLLGKAGFSGIEFHPSLSGEEKGDGNLFVMTAHKV